MPNNFEFTINEDVLNRVVSDGLTKKWDDFCARMRGRSPDEIKREMKSQWGTSAALSDDGAGMISRGERVNADVAKFKA